MSTLRVFAENMNSLGLLVERNAIRLHRRVAEEVVDHVANGTPIDTGRASGNWITNIGAPSQNFDDSETGGPQTSMQDVRAKLASLAMGQVVHITNNTPYIVPLNQGTSQQAPAAFVETAAVSALNVIGNFNLLVR